MTPSELEVVSRQVGDLQGWDFSRVQAVEEGATWDYRDLVRQYLLPESVALDLGTGGGEVFLEFAGNLDRAYGIDQSPDRLAAARRNRERSGARQFSFMLMDAAALAFPVRSLDIVLASFAAYGPQEVYRVLRPGGVFITQQIGDDDTANIFETFGWGSYGAYWRARYEAGGGTYVSTRETGRQFESLGCRVLRYDEYNARQYYLDLPSLVFYLKASPLPWPFSPETFAAPLTALLQRYGSEHGIESNAHRELLIVQR